MGYFDSAKNRAAWQKELAQLKRQKEKLMGRIRSGLGGGSENPHRRRITLAELEKRVFGDRMGRSDRRARTRTAEPLTKEKTRRSRSL